MRLPSVLAAVLLLSVFVASTWAELEFPKGSTVRLKKDAPLLFKDKEARTGKAGESFTVVQHNTATKRVYVLATDGDGKQVALNVEDDAVEFAPYDVSRLRAALLPLCEAEKPDLAGAAKIVGQAAVEAPSEPQVQEYRAAIRAAQAAQEKVLAANKETEDAKQRVAQLSKSAWAARNNIADPQGGFARSQQMKAEAEQVTATAKTDREKAATDLEAAKKNLAETLRKSVSTPYVDQPARIVASPASTATEGKPHSNADSAPARKDGGAVAQPPLMQDIDKLPEAITVPMSGGQYGDGTRYRFIGPATQMTADFLMVANPVTKQAFGMFLFGDPKKAQALSVEPGTMIEAVIRFKFFKDITLLSGATQRMPVFECIGFGPVGGRFTDTSKVQE
jgi:hypothetical protein